MQSVILFPGPSLRSILFSYHVAFVFFGFLADAVSAAKSDQKASSYALAQAIPVSCLNRTMYVSLSRSWSSLPSAIERNSDGIMC